MKNIVLFVNSVPPGTFDSIKHVERVIKKKITPVLIADTKTDLSHDQESKKFEHVIRCSFDDERELQRAISHIDSKLIGAVCMREKNVPLFARLVPYVPYLRTPTRESLLWAVDKIEMRRHMFRRDKNLGPKYSVVEDSSDATIRRVSEKIGFPLVVKPAGLAASKLVTICFHEDELRKTLKYVFAQITKLYSQNERRSKPRVLVEQFMEGKMYSIDGYVSSRGRIDWCPMVYVKTGREIGFDDFFGYLQMTPTTLSDGQIRQAQKTAAEAVRALGLRSSTVHVELLRTDTDWKIIEIGPRVGGFRSPMYRLTYGIDHRANDILVKVAHKPVIPQKRKGFAAAMKIYAKKEGIIKKIIGLKRLRELQSFSEMEVNLKAGDKARFAKNGGASVFNVILFNKKRSNLLADIRRLEQTVKIDVG